MAVTFFQWFQTFCIGSKYAFEWLTSHPFENITFMPPELRLMTPLFLLSLGGVIIFIVVAIVKWVIS